MTSKTPMTQLPPSGRAANDVVPLDFGLDVQQRLADLRAWQAEWQREDARILARARAVTGATYADIELGAQLSSLRRRLELTLVKQPIEIPSHLATTVGFAALRARLVAQFVALSTEDRLLWLNNFLFLLTPDLRRLEDKIAKVRSVRQQTVGQHRNFLLGGPSGMGKTSALNWLVVRNMPTVEEERNRVPIIKVDAPVSNSSPKPLYRRMILECGKAFVRRDTEDELLSRLALYFLQCDVELLIVDEIQHMIRHEMRRRLLEISNRTHGMPIICASCDPLEFTNNDTEIAGRWNDKLDLHPFTPERLAQLLAFVELLLPLSGESPLALGEVPEEDAAAAGNAGAPAMVRPLRIAEQIYRWTGGILRDIMILIVDACSRAIREHSPTLTYRMLEAAWRNLQASPNRNFVEALSSSGLTGRW